MHSDGKYKNLQTTNLVAKSIVAEEITLQETTIKCDPMIAGATVKRLYESQRNTNAFDDSAKRKLESLDAALPRSTQNVHVHKIPLLTEFDINSIPEKHAVMCFDNTGAIVYVCKFNNTIKHYTLPVYEPYVKLSISVDNDTPSVKLKVT